MISGKLLAQQLEKFLKSPVCSNARVQVRLPQGEFHSPDGYFDVNAHVGYQITNRFTAFLKANNIASQGYEKWQAYPVQQLQILGGVIYKFDF